MHFGVFSGSEALIRKNTIFQKVCGLFPDELRCEIGNIIRSSPDYLCQLSEIRIRRGEGSALTLRGRNRRLCYSMGEDEVEQLFHRLCGGAVYAHSETLREGYIIYMGCRVGVAGSAVIQDGIVTAITRVTSLCFRIPGYVEGAADAAYDVWQQLKSSRGMLIYSAPGVGKTTLLCDLIRRLSTGSAPIRVAVVDTRGELEAAVTGEATVDVLSLFPRAEGIEIATRVLSPQVVICDEIGGYEEAESILGVQNCGVPIIATAHGDSYAALMQRAPIRLLHSCGTFGAYVGIHRRGGRYIYTVDYVEGGEADSAQTENEK